MFLATNQTSKGCDSNGKQSKFSGPRQFTVVGLSSVFVNTPPVLLSPKDYEMEENEGTLITALKAYDAEGDQVTFELNNEDELPLNGKATLERQGNFSYKPCMNCHGLETVKLTLKEDRCDGQIPLTTDVELTVRIGSVNHPPVQVKV